MCVPACVRVSVPKSNVYFTAGKWVMYRSKKRLVCRRHSCFHEITLHLETTTVHSKFEKVTRVDNPTSSFYDEQDYAALLRALTNATNPTSLSLANRTLWFLPDLLAFEARLQADPYVWFDSLASNWKWRRCDGTTDRVILESLDRSCVWFCLQRACSLGFEKDNDDQWILCAAKATPSDMREAFCQESFV